jgi:hypothetical protein
VRDDESETNVCKQPEADDPFALSGVGVPDPDGTAVREMAACFAEEFLRLGFPPGRVLALFESPRYPLAHRAYAQLGAAETRALIERLAATWSPAHRHARVETR